MTDFQLARPRGARGVLPLVLGAYAVGKGIYGAISGNQRRQRMKGYINDAYRSALQRQNVHDTDVRQDTAESLNARGILSQGPQFTQTSPSLTQSAYGGGQPSTLGGQMEADTNRELALEHHDLDASHTRALNENNADYANDLVGAATGTAQGIMQAYSIGHMPNLDSAPGARTPTATPSPSATMSGDASEIPNGSQFHPQTGEVLGAYGLHPNSAMPQTLSAYGQSNSDFHVG